MDKRESFKLTLKEIVDKHGRESMLDGKNLKGLLMDYMPDFRAERNLLLSAIRLDIPRVLIRPSDIEINTNKAVNILKEELFVNDNAAAFIVDAIAYSLGVNILLTTTETNSTPIKRDEDCEIAEDGTSDPLFKNVLKFALDCGQVSVLMLRRRFSVDNNRANSLIHTLYKLGVISKNIDCKPCEVIISRQEAEARFRLNQGNQSGKEVNYYNQNKVNSTNNSRVITIHNPESNKNQPAVVPAENIEELRKKYARAKAELDLADSYLKKAELSKRVAQERFNSAYSSNRGILQEILDRKTQGFDQAALDYQKALQNFQIAEGKYNKAVQSDESICPCCKESNPNSAKFCHNCGNRIKR